MNQVQSNVTNSNVTQSKVTFPDGRHTTLVEAKPGASAKDITKALGLITVKPKAVILIPSGVSYLPAPNRSQETVKPKAVILIVGGTDSPNDNLQARLLKLFSRGLARAVAKNGALIIGGRTESKVMSTLGKALLDRGDKAFLLGTANDSQVTWSGQKGADSANGHKMLESTYTHFVVVKGADSDGEIDTMYGIAEEFSRNILVLTILVNNSSTARDEVIRSVRQKWPVLVIGGGGGFADEIQQAWQARQNSIQDYKKAISQWKSGDPNKPKLILPFIPDPELAEVIAEGDLHFFPITGAPEKLELYIDFRLKANEILSQAQAQHKIYSGDSTRQQKLFRRQQLAILILGVVITFLAAFQSFYGQRGWNEKSSIPTPFGSFNGLLVGNILYYVLIALPVVLALFLAGANHFNPGNKWIAMRAAAEAVKREMFRYRTRTGMYSNIQMVQNDTTREATLANMLESISMEWAERNLDFVIFPKPSKQEKPKKSLSVYLPPDRYIDERLVDQLNWYKGKTRGLGRKLKWLQWLTLGLGGVATLLAALHFELVITVTTAIATALVTYLEYNQVADTLKQYNHASLRLTEIQNWWVALEDAQADQANIDKLVDDVETALQSEHVGWVQQMQTALTRLSAQQTKQGEDSSATGPNKGLEGQPSPTTSRSSKQSPANQSVLPKTGSTSANGSGSAPADGSSSAPIDDSGSEPANSSGSASEDSSTTAS